MKQKVIVVLLGIIVFLAIGVVVGLGIYKYFAPSKERVDLQTVYNTPKDEVRLYINDELWDGRGVYANETVYIDFETVQSNLTENIYYDSNENMLIVTTDVENIVAKQDSSTYEINGEKKEFGSPVYISKGGKLYVAIDFVTQYSAVESSFYSNPNRAMIYCDFEKEFLAANVSEDTVVRVEGDKKSPIVWELKEGDKVHIKAQGTELSKGYVGVLTKEGVEGYVKEDAVKNSMYETMTTDYKDGEYKRATSLDKVNMTWHAIYKECGAAEINSLIDASPGVNVVSPTWFRLTDEKGNFSSIANKSYVEAAHNKGVQVWALISDVEQKIDTYELFSYTSKRKTLLQGLMEKVKEYNIDGINVDFETINSKSSPHYIQFIKELSVECRKEGIVLTTDTYVPMPFNSFYRRDIQGKYVDYVVIMAYDEHYSGSEESGSVSSISWVTNAVNNTKKDVSSDKIIIGIPFYTRLWEEKKNSDGSIKIESVQSLSMKTANETVSKNSATIVYNEETGQDFAQYEKNGSTYKMWMENGKSIRLKLNAIKEGGCAGVASWRAGFETEDIWTVIDEAFMK